MGLTLSRASSYTLVSPEAELMPAANDGQMPPFARGLLLAVIGCRGSGRATLAQAVRDLHPCVEMTSSRECARNMVGAVFGETYDFVVAWEAKRFAPPSYAHPIGKVVDEMENLLHVHKKEAWLEAALCHCPTHLVALSESTDDARWFRANGFVVVLLVRPELHGAPEGGDASEPVDELHTVSERFLRQTTAPVAPVAEHSIFDYVMRNDATLDELRQRASMLLDDLSRRSWEERFGSVAADVQPYFDSENAVRYGFVPPTLRKKYEIVGEEE